jgi:choline-sulfatase
MTEAQLGMERIPGGALTRDKETRRPNILFILSDQHTQKIAGCYGDPLASTPAIDALAARGVVFDNAYCASPVCVPSRMSLLTGQHPHAQECWTNDDFLASDRPSWAHAMGAAGYRPTLIGRLHALGPDQLHGFAERRVGDHSPNWPGVSRHDLGPLARANDPWPESLARSGPGRCSYEMKDEDTAEAACDFLRDAGARQRAGDDAPFCLHVGFILPHPPYVCGEADYAHFAGRIPLPALPRPDAEHPWLTWWRRDRGIEQVADDDALRARAAYYGLVASMDRMIGNILATLEAEGLAGDTLVVYASDHGDQLGERGLWWKHTFYEESVKVPLVIAWPGRLPEGERRDGIVELSGLGPTLLEAAGAPALPHARAQSFLGLARDAAHPWHGEAFSEYCTDAVPAWTGGMAVQQRMIRSGRWKLVYYAGYRPQLFDLRADPDELHDLGESPDHADMRAALVARVLERWDPAAIAARMRERRRDKDLIGAWVAQTRPRNTHLWDLHPEQNRLAAT